jgi:hypothetical protein
MLEIITKLPQNGCKTMEKKKLPQKTLEIWFCFGLKPLENPLIEYYFYLTVDESNTAIFLSNLPLPFFSSQMILNKN